MTKDFLYDLLEGLEKQDTQYLLMAHTPDSPESPHEVYFSFNNKEEAEVTLAMCKAAMKAIKKEFKIK